MTQEQRTHLEGRLREERERMERSLDCAGAVPTPA
jgi:hypothetical protein